MLNESASRLAVKPPYLFLITAGILDFLLITMGSSFSFLGYYLTEYYLIIPPMLFLGYMLREKLSVFSKRRLLLSAATLCWFILVQMQHKLTGMGSHPISTVFLVYLLAFPFASMTEDRESIGITCIGKIFVAASLVLVGYTALLILGMLPAYLKDLVFWDGSRLNCQWHPNIAACYFMIGIGFCAAFFARAKKRSAKILLVLAIAVQFAAMALTNCRTTILMTGALFGGILFFHICKGGWKRFFMSILVALIMLVVSFKISGSFFLWNNDRLVTQITVTQDADGITDQSSDILAGDNVQDSLGNDLRTLNNRTYIWEAALNALRDNRTLVFWGTEYSGTVISAYNISPVVHAHNSWIEVLMRMGIIGLLFALVFTAVSVFSAIKLLFHKNTELWKKIIAMTTMCVMVSGALEPYLFITNVYYHIPDFLFFLCTGYLDYWCHCLPGKASPAAATDAAVSA